MKNGIFINFFVIICNLIVVPTLIHAETYLFNFDNNTLPAQLSTTTPEGFNIDIINGKAVFTKENGTGNGFGVLTTNFQLLGDFTVSVQISLDDVSGIGEAGLSVSYAPLYPNGFSDVWSYGDTNNIVGNIFIPSPPGFGTSVIYNVSESVLTYEIQRTGNTLSLFFDRGDGLEFVRSSTNEILNNPVYVQLFLGQETNHYNSHQVSFDNFTISAQKTSNAVPTPSSILLAYIGITVFIGFTRKKHSAHN